jgi:hypothetical protein
MRPFSMGKMLLIAAICGRIAACPAQAMNWEGHDDWMADLPPAIELQSAMPVTPLPAVPSQTCQSGLQFNPYEQIPLATDICGMISPATGHERSGAQP